MLNKGKSVVHYKNKIATALILIILISNSTNFAAGEIPQKRYIFIDGGAFNGRLYQTFQAISSYSKYSWEIFAIEANPYIIDQLPQEPNVKILNKAIWSQDGTIDFYVDMAPDSYNTSSLFKDNPEEPHQITVESIDFSQWLKRNFTENDYIIVNLDIEGAEYEVLEKMVADKTLQYIDRLYVEFHPELFVNHPGEKGDEFCEAVDERGMKLLGEMKKSGVIFKCASLWDIILKDTIGEIKWSDFSE